MTSAEYAAHRGQAVAQQLAEAHRALQAATAAHTFALRALRALDGAEQEAKAVAECGEPWAAEAGADLLRGIAEERADMQQRLQESGAVQASAEQAVLDLQGRANALRELRSRAEAHDTAQPVSAESDPQEAAP